AGGGQPGPPAPQARRVRGRRSALDRRGFSGIIAALVVSWHRAVGAVCWSRARGAGTLSGWPERGGHRMTDQNELLKRAAHVLPGGVLGNHRSGPGLEFVVKEGRGAYLWDTNGRRYLDYLLGSGPMVLGHAHPAV